MTQSEKLRQKLLGLPAEMRFSDVRLILEDADWILERTTGSHHQFTKPGERTLVVTEHKGKVKRGYLREIAGKLDVGRMD